MVKTLHTSLSRRERQIIDILYRRGRATAAEVMEDLPGDPSYSTVRTQLRVLEEKGHVRHCILAAEIVCAATAPVLRSLGPSWTLPSLAAPATTHTPDVDVSFRPVGTPTSRVVAATSAPPSQQMPLLARAANLFVPIWLIGLAFNFGVLAIGMARLTRLRSSGVGHQESATISESLRHMSAV